MSCTGVGLSALIFACTLFAGASYPLAAQSKRFCAAYPDFRDQTLVAAFDKADAQYKIHKGHADMLVRFRNELGTDLGFNGSDGRLAFGQFAQATKVSADLMLDLLAFTEEGEAAVAKSIVLQTIDEFEIAQAVENKPIDLAVVLAAKENAAGRIFKSLYGVYDGVREMADMGGKRDEYVRAAKEQLDALDHALVAANTKRGKYEDRIKWINSLKTELDGAYTRNCVSPTAPGPATPLPGQNDPAVTRAQIATVLDQSMRAPMVERRLIAYMLREGAPDLYGEIWLERLARAGYVDPNKHSLDALALRTALLQLDSAQLALRKGAFRLGVLGALDSAAGTSLRPYAARLAVLGALPPDPTRQFLRTVANTVLRRVGPTLLPHWDEATMRRIAVARSYVLDESPEGLARLDSMFSDASRQAMQQLAQAERLQIGKTLQAQWGRLLDQARAGHWKPPEAVESVTNAVNDMAALARATKGLVEREAAAAEQISRAQENFERQMRAAVEDVSEHTTDYSRAKLASLVPSARDSILKARTQLLELSVTQAMARGVKLDRSDIEGLVRRATGATGQLSSISDRIQRLADARIESVDDAIKYATDAGAAIDKVAGGLFGARYGQEVSKAVSVAKTGFSIVANVMSGNFLGAVGGLGGLFGGGGPFGGPDPITEQFEQVNQKLDTIDQKLDKLADQIDKLDQKVDRLTDLVTANHAAVMRAIEQARVDVRELSRLVVADDWVELSLCYDGKALLEPNTYVVDSVVVEANDTRLSACESRLNRVTADLDYAVSPPRLLWRFAGLSDPSAASVHYYDEHVTPLLAFFESWPGPRRAGPQAFVPRPRLLAALTETSTSYGELDAKIGGLDARTDIASFPLRAFRTPVLDSAVILVANTVLNIYPIFSMLEGGTSPRLKPRARLFVSADQAVPVGTKGEAFLRRMLKIVDLALAQQNLLDGDMLLQRFADDIGGAETTERIRRSPTLAQNVVRFYLYEQIGPGGTWPLNKDCSSGPVEVADETYRRVSTGRDVGAMIQLLTRVRCPGNTPVRVAPQHVTPPSAGGHPYWTVQFRDFEIALPTVEEFARREFLVSPSVPRLQQLRVAIEDALASYELPRTVKESPAMGAATALLVAPR